MRVYMYQKHQTIYVEIHRIIDEKYKTINTYNTLLSSYRVCSSLTLYQHILLLEKLTNLLDLLYKSIFCSKIGK